MIDTPTLEMNDSRARTAMDRSISAAIAPTRVRALDSTAGG